MSEASEDLYREELLTEAQYPQHYGELVDADFVFRGTNASCGDIVTLYLKVNDKNDPQATITEYSWTGSGCVISRAGASVFSEMVLSQALSLMKAADITQSQLETALGLKDISVNRIKCLLLALNTLKQNA